MKEVFKSAEVYSEEGDQIVITARVPEPGDVLRRPLIELDARLFYRYDDQTVVDTYLDLSREQAVRLHAALGTALRMTEETHA